MGPPSRLLITQEQIAAAGVKSVSILRNKELPPFSSEQMSKSSKRSSWAHMARSVRHSWSAPIRLPSKDSLSLSTRVSGSQKSRVYSLSPVVASTTTSPPLFLTELPMPLVPYLPAPTFRRFETKTNKQSYPGTQPDTEPCPCISRSLIHLFTHRVCYNSSFHNSRLSYLCRS